MTISVRFYLYFNKVYNSDRWKGKLHNCEYEKFPFIAEFDCYHTHPMMTLPIGCDIELDATNKKITIMKIYA